MPHVLPTERVLLFESMRDVTICKRLMETADSMKAHGIGADEPLIINRSEVPQFVAEIAALSKKMDKINCRIMEQEMLDGVVVNYAGHPVHVV